MCDVRVCKCVMHELRIEMMGANGGYHNITPLLRYPYGVLVALDGFVVVRKI
jgi:hypothetical protein